MRALLIPAAVAFLCHPAIAQQQEVVLMDLRLFNMKDETATIDGMPNSKPMDIMGFVVGRPGPDQQGRANALAKSQGYVVEFTHDKLRCNGRVITGVSTPFLTEIRARKTNNDLYETIKVNLASPNWSNQTIGVERIIKYAMIDTAPSVDEVVKNLRDKYGNVFTSQAGRFNQVGYMRWETGPALLEVHFDYFDNRPGIVSQLRFKQTRMGARGPVDYYQQDRQSLCAQTNARDEAALRQMREKSGKGPNL